MERYKDRDHAFLVGMLFVLMFLWNSAFVCICFVCLSPLVSDGPSVCLCPSVSRGLSVCVSLCFSGLCLSVCLSRTSCVSCLLCLLSVPPRLLLSCVGLGCLVLSPVWFSLRVTSLCCLCVVFTLPLVLLRSFVLWFFPFVLSLLCSFIRPMRLMFQFFLTRIQIKLSNLPLKSS